LSVNPQYQLQLNISSPNHILVTLRNPTNPNRNSKTTKLIFFRQTRPRKPSRRCCIYKQTASGHQPRVTNFQTSGVVFSASTLGSRCGVHEIICLDPQRVDNVMKLTIYTEMTFSKY